MSLLSEFFKSLAVRRGSRARFALSYRPGPEPGVLVGHLEFDGTTWSFKYDEAYRRRPDLRPLEGFEDLQRIYRSPALFPFFAVRIPDRERPDIDRLLKASKVTDPDAVDLLRLFGERAASSPGFQLVAEAS